jgi:hypothetical protein
MTDWKSIETLTITGPEGTWIDQYGYLPPEACLQKLPAIPDVPGFPGRPVQGWMVVARLCEPWELDPQGQQRKLKEAAWAWTEILSVHDASGRRQELFCVNIEAVPMWWATLTPGKVNPELRSKLEYYQQRAAGQLDAWARKRLGVQSSAELESRVTALESLVGQYQSMLEQTGKVLGAISLKLETLMLGQGVLTPQQASALKWRVKHIAELRESAGCFEKSRNGARRAILNKLQACCAWSGKGCSWDKLSAAKYGVALAKLDELQDEAMRAIKLKCASRQNVLPFTG